MPAQPLATVGVIARRLDAQLHQVEYVIRSRRIDPVFVAGNSRVFSDAQVDRIASELRRIKENHTGALDCRSNYGQETWRAEEVSNARC